jgi:hypothetical protein
MKNDTSLHLTNFSVGLIYWVSLDQESYLTITGSKSRASTMLIPIAATEFDPKPLSFTPTLKPISLNWLFRQLFSGAQRLYFHHLRIFLQIAIKL